MKKFIPLVVIAAGWIAWAGVASGAEQKIGIVDLRKVFDKYYKTIQSTATLKLEAADMEKERKQMMDNAEKHKDEWQKLIDKANDQAVSSEERDKSKKEAEQKYVELENDKQSITEFDRVASSRLREKELQRRDDIVKEIRQILDADAKAAGYTLVLDPSGESQNMVPVVLYTNGQNDLTDSLIKELNSTAPPGALDTNAAASLPSTDGSLTH
ncbi:MAG TPA: OmpH family outer membrane protein [Candidatus Baltobacteraceae bacterium]|jgi:Skp family chaperone for outer membrane proteins|nr:OmpH family outer membrane protein [Candidatus Baltobacteraceae bacterium]